MTPRRCCAGGGVMVVRPLAREGNVNRARAVPGGPGREGAVASPAWRRVRAGRGTSRAPGGASGRVVGGCRAGGGVVGAANGRHSGAGGLGCRPAGLRLPVPHLPCPLAASGSSGGPEACNARAHGSRCGLALSRQARQSQARHEGQRGRRGGWWGRRDGTGVVGKGRLVRAGTS